jgi:hypothetical protein
MGHPAKMKAITAGKNKSDRLFGRARLGRWTGRRLLAANAGAGEEITETRSRLTLRLNEKFLALEVAGMFQ